MDSTAYSRKFPHLYRGIVESNTDPDHMGRCKVRVPSIHGEMKYPASALPWARPIVLSPVKSKRGSVNIPDVGDVVWVFFEGAVRECPVYIGGTYAKVEIVANPDIVDFYIEEDNKISYNRKTEEYEITIGGSTIKMTKSGVSIEGDTQIKGNLKVSGTLTVSNINILNSCNRECDCP